jgi:hypothetical protein
MPQRQYLAGCASEAIQPFSFLRNRLDFSELLGAFLEQRFNYSDRPLFFFFRFFNNGFVGSG